MILNFIVLCICMSGKTKTISSTFYSFLFLSSSDDIQPSTLITDQSLSGLLLDIKAQEYCIMF